MLHSSGSRRLSAQPPPPRTARRPQLARAVPPAMAVHARAAAASGQCALALPSIPVKQVDAGVRATLERDLGAKLQGVRWDEEPDRFDDIAFDCLKQHLLTGELLAELRGMLDDPARPVALHVKGLPQDADLPPTPESPPVKKEGQLTEAMLMGFSRVWGRAAGIASAGPPGLCRDYIETPEHILSSSTELTMHRDYGIAEEHQVPNVRLIYCLRPDKGRQVQTLVADNRDVLAAMDPADVALLRQVPVKIEVPSFKFGASKCLIQGSEELPVLTLFDNGAFGGDAVVTSEDPAAVAAYYRASDAAMEVAASVRLQLGEILIINNCRALHARTEAPQAGDGMGRWIKTTLIKAGAGAGSDRYLDLQL